MRHPLLTLFLLALPPAFSQSRDSIILNYSTFDTYGESQLDLAVGAPPLQIKSVRMVNSVSYKKLNLKPAVNDGDITYKPMSLGYSPSFQYILKSGVLMIAGLNVSVRNADGSFGVAGKSIFISAFPF